MICPLCDGSGQPDDESLRFTCSDCQGSGMVEDAKCPNCGSNCGCDCYGDYEDEDEDDYYGEDYDDYGNVRDYDDDDGYPYEYSVSVWLIKAPNGHIAIGHGILGRYDGEDWGEASFWHQSVTKLSALVDETRLAIVAFALALEPGRHDFSYDWLEDDDDDDAPSQSWDGEFPYTDPPAAPTTVDEIPF